MNTQASCFYSKTLSHMNIYLILTGNLQYFFLDRYLLGTIPNKESKTSFRIVI